MITWLELCGALKYQSNGLKTLNLEVVHGPDDLLKLGIGDEPCPMATTLPCLIDLVWSSGRI